MTNSQLIMESMETLAFIEEVLCNKEKRSAQKLMEIAFLAGEVRGKLSSFEGGDDE